MAVGTKFLSLAVTLTIVFFVVNDVVASTCPPHVTKLVRSYTATHNHVCYLFINKELFWSKASERCWDLGGEMLYIDSQETMDFIKRKLDSPELSWDREGVWLGASKEYGRWSWTNGRLMNYTNWAPGQPSMLLGLLSVEHCSQMRQDDGWKWHDVPCGGLKFHYNYVCQFPAVEATTSTTPTITTPTTSSTSTSSRASFYRTHDEFNSEDYKRLREEFFRTHDEFNSEDYKRLREEFFRMLNGHDLSVSPSTFYANRNPAALNRPGDVAGRVSSSAADQTEDNGNSNILAIIIGISTGLLLIMGIIFLMLFLHQRRKRQKTSESTVHFSNNTYHRSPIGLAIPDNHAPAIPTSQVPYSSNEDLYLDPDPQQDKKHREHALNTNFSPNGCSCNHNQKIATNSICSSLGTDSELGACGGSDPERELKVPLMASLDKTNSELVGTNCVAHSPLDSCVSSSQGEYMDMNIIAQEKKKNKHAKEEDEKHTYSNVENRDSGIENLYEVLP